MVTTKEATSARARARAAIAEREKAEREERLQTENDLSEVLSALDKVEEWEQRAGVPLARLLKRRPAAEVSDLTGLTVSRLKGIAGKASDAEQGTAAKAAERPPAKGPESAAAAATEPVSEAG